MNRLLAFAAIIEAATGVALMAMPAAVVRLLLGGELTGASIPLGRVAGVALLSLGISCWPGGNSLGNTAPARRAMLTYNALVALYLFCLGIRGESVGLLLWPAVLMHSILSLLLARQWRVGNVGQ
jgi:hypothetical protein